MHEKHRGDVEFIYTNGLFKSISDIESVQLFQLYEREVRQGKPIDLPPANNGFLLLYGMYGNGVCRINDKDYAIAPKTLLCCSHTAYTVSVVSDKPCGFVCVNFTMHPHTLSNDLHAFYALISSSDGVVVAEDTAQLKTLLTGMIGELCLIPQNAMLIKGMLDQILVATYRCFLNRTDTITPDEPSAHVVGHTVYAIVRYIDDHLFSIHNLSEMAAELGYSYNYLSHLFRRKTGSTIQAYVSRKKIEKSTELLSSGRFSVTEIAAMLNYDCIQSFSKAFKKAMGVSPTEYRVSKGFSDNE